MISRLNWECKMARKLMWVTVVFAVCTVAGFATGYVRGLNNKLLIAQAEAGRYKTEIEHGKAEAHYYLMSRKTPAFTHGDIRDGLKLTSLDR